MKSFNIEVIKNEVLALLEKQLPAHLTYHNKQHTLYVLNACELISKNENISEKDFELLQIACLFHDIGFINTYDNHEAEGCVIAKAMLPEFCLSKMQIDLICGMIMATKIPQTPKNKLEEIIADADLEYLGTKNYNEISEGLYKELLHFNENLSEKNWLLLQINFLENHRYFTQYCIKNREEVKQINLHTLKEKYSRMV